MTTTSIPVPINLSERTAEQQAAFDALSCPHGRTWYWAHQTCCNGQTTVVRRGA